MAWSSGCLLSSNTGSSQLTWSSNNQSKMGLLKLFWLKLHIIINRLLEESAFLNQSHNIQSLTTLLKRSAWCYCKYHQSLWNELDLIYQPFFSCETSWIIMPWAVLALDNATKINPFANSTSGNLTITQSYVSLWALCIDFAFYINPFLITNRTSAFGDAMIETVYNRRIMECASVVSIWWKVVELLGPGETGIELDA